MTRSVSVIGFIIDLLKNFTVRIIFILLFFKFINLNLIKANLYSILLTTVSLVVIEITKQRLNNGNMVYKYLYIIARNDTVCVQGNYLCT